MSKSPLKRARFWLALVSLALVAGACIALLRSGLLSEVDSVDELRDVIGRAGPLAWLTFFLLQMLTVIVAPIPSNVTMMAGALALGFTRALLLGVLAILCGSMLVFLAARRLGRAAVLRLIDRGVMDKYLPLIEEKEDMFLFLTLLFPFFPDDILCILAGLTGISAKRFALIMTLARPWGLVFAALIGCGALRMPAWAWGALLLGMAVVFYIMMRYSAPIEDALLRVFSRRTGGKKK